MLPLENRTQSVDDGCILGNSFFVIPSKSHAGTCELTKNFPSLDFETSEILDKCAEKFD